MAVVPPPLYRCVFSQAFALQRVRARRTAAVHFASWAELSVLAACGRRLAARRVVARWHAAVVRARRVHRKQLPRRAAFFRLRALFVRWRTRVAARIEQTDMAVLYVPFSSSVFRVVLSDV